MESVVLWIAVVLFILGAFLFTYAARRLHRAEVRFERAAAIYERLNRGRP